MLMQLPPIELFANGINEVKVNFFVELLGRE